MASFKPGDAVHVALFGKGIVREVRNSGRCLVDVKRRAMEVAQSQLSPLADQPGSPVAGVRRGRPSERPKSADTTSDGRRVVTLDLHGHTVDEALEALARCLNDALLAGASEIHVIHGRSGGRIRAAVHRRLKEWPSVRTFQVHSHNPGVTIVVL